MESERLDTPEKQDLPTRKLNIFALPSQTTILVVLVICAIYATAIAISVGPTFFPLWPLMVGLAILSLRGWLGWPERQHRLHHLTPANQQFPALQELIAQLVYDRRLKRTPYLMISQKPVGPYIYGGWRRWYIALGQQQAAEIEASLRDQDNRPYIEAVFLHELHHFKLGDHRLIEYTRALLHAGWQLLGWGGFFIFGWMILLAILTQDILRMPPTAQAARVEAQLPGLGLGQFISTILPPDAEWQEVKQIAPNVNPLLAAMSALINTWVVVVISAALVSLFWRKIARLREFYADAAVAHIQGTSAFLADAHAFILSTIPLQLATDEHLSKSQHLKNRFQRSTASIFSRLPATPEWLQYHPSRTRRIAALDDPRLVFDDWPKSAWLIGLFVLVLDLMLTQTTAQYYLGPWPLHFTVITTFILTSLTSIVEVVLGRSAWRNSVRVIAVVMLLRTGIVVLMLAIIGISVLVAPYRTGDSFDMIAYPIWNYAGVDEDPTAQNLPQLALVASIKMLTELPVGLLILLAATWAQLQVTQRVLTWYSYPNAYQHILRIIYGSIALFAGILALAVLPILTDIVRWRFTDALSPSRWIFVIALLLATLAAYWWFRFQDRRYARRCSKCGAVLGGQYQLGRRCNVCDHWLHEWLYIHYSTETNT